MSGQATTERLDRSVSRISGGNVPDLSVQTLRQRLSIAMTMNHENHHIVYDQTIQSDSESIDSSDSESQSSDDIDDDGTNDVELLPVKPNVTLPKSSLKERSMIFNIRSVVGQLTSAKEKEIQAARRERKEYKKRLKKAFNFVVGSGGNTKLFRYEDVSFGCLTVRNRFRQFCVRLIASKTFNRILLTLILLNTVFIASASYDKVDSRGNLLTDGSTINQLNVYTNTWFVYAFTLEILIKCVAQGIYGEHGAYLSQMWNYLDVIVVASGLAVIADSTLENVSSLRIIRILRPLRSLKMIPTMNSILSAIFSSIPQLSGVFSLMCFIVVLFAICGMNLFGDASAHALCRSTPYPVKISYISPQSDPTSTHKYEDFRCLDVPNFSLIGDGGIFTKANSPWSVPQSCYWPLAGTVEDASLCSLDGSGLNKCIHDTPFLSPDQWTWCGSNFDALGNRRFKQPANASYSMYGNGFYSMNDYDTFYSALDYGYTTFDTFGTSILTVFQSITQEGWSNILYMCWDAYGPYRAVCFFVVLIIFGVYFILQMLLAVLEENFSKSAEEIRAQALAEKLERDHELLQFHGDRSGSLVIGIVENSLVQRNMIRKHLEIITEYTDKSIFVNLFANPEDFIASVSRKEKLLKDYDILIVGQQMLPNSAHKVIGMQGHELIMTLKRFPTSPLHRLKHIIGCTANVDEHQELLQDAGASVVVTPKPVDFDRGCSLALNENDDIVHVLLNLLDLGMDNLATALPVESDASLMKEGIDFDGVISQLTSPDRDEGLQDDMQVFEESEIFTTRAATHAYEKHFRSIMKYGNDLICSCEMHNMFPFDAKLEVVVKPRKGLLKKKCCICEDVINYHYLYCKSCKTNVCMQCGDVEWARPVVAGEVIDTLYGECIIEEYRPVSARQRRGKEPATMTVPSVICSPAKWTLANECKPKLFINIYDLKDDDFGVGDEVMCTYGGPGTIVGMRISLCSGVQYKVELHNWILATNKSPDLYLSKSAIRFKMKDARLQRAAYMEQLLRSLDRKAAEVNTDHDAEVDAPHSPDASCKMSNLSRNLELSGSRITRPKLRKSVSNVSNVTNASSVSNLSSNSKNSKGSINSGEHSEASLHIPILPNKGVLWFLSKRLKDLRLVMDIKGWKRAKKLLHKKASASMLELMNESGSSEQFYRTRHPDSYIHLRYIGLHDFIGDAACKKIFLQWACIKGIIKATISKVMGAFGRNVTTKTLKKHVHPTEYSGLAKWRHTVVLGCQKIANWSKFDFFSGLLIVVNTGLLMSDHWPMNPDVAGALDISNAIVTILFAIEMAILVIAKGAAYYVKDAMSAFDALIIIISVLDLILFPPLAFRYNVNISDTFSNVSSIVSLLRTFRLFRIIKLSLQIQSLKILLFRIVKTLRQLASFLILLTIVIFCFTVAGLQFFANKFRFDSNGNVISEIGSAEWLNAPQISQSNFDTFSLAFASVFQIMTTENWNTILYDCWRSSGPAGVLFPISWICIGTFILMNLFLGILLGNFTSDDSKAADDDQAELELREGRSVENMVKSDIGSIWATSSMMKAQITNNKTVSTKAAVVEKPEVIKAVTSEVSAAPAPADTEVTSLNAADQSEPTEEKVPNEIIHEMKSTPELTALGSTAENGLDVFPLPSIKSVGIFAPDNRIRVMCAKVLSSSKFELFIQLLIFISSVSLTLYSPLLDPDAPESQAFAIFDLVTTVLFAIEMIIKIITFGFLLNQRSYLRNYWNVLDFAIVITSILGHVFADSQIGHLKAIRSFRALRPLRFISRAPGLRIIVIALLESIPDVLKVVGIILVIFSIFSVLAVNFLKGGMRQCGGPIYDYVISQDVEYLDLLRYPVPFENMSPVQQSWFGPSSPLGSFGSCTQAPCCNLSHLPYYFPSDAVAPTSRMICDCWGGDWIPVTYQTFDNFASAMLGFTIISTTEGWVNVMYAAVENRGVDMHPVPRNKYIFIYFFITFIIAGTYFGLNLLVGVMLDNFQRVTKEQALDGKKSVFMTPEQQEWVRTYQIVKAVTPLATKRAPTDKIGMLAYGVVKHPWFERVVLLSIVLNAIALAVSHFGMDDRLTIVLEYINLFFSAFFTLEMLIKLFAYKMTYFRSYNDVFDGIVTIGTDIGCVVYFVYGLDNGLSVMAVRLFRVLRVVRLIEGLSDAKRLLDALMFTLPGVFNITLLVIILLLIYASLGIQLFAKISFFRDYNVHANFRNFGTALLTLFRFSTGEGWGSFMYFTRAERPGCDPDPAYDHGMCGFNDHPGCIPLNGCGNIAIYPFLVSFTILVNVVVFNLFIGVVLEGFQSANKSAKVLRSKDFHVFAKHWANYDPDGGLYLSVDKFEEFIATLPAPMGLADQHPSHSATIAFVSSLNINIYKNNGKCEYVHFKEILVSLSAKAVEASKGGDVSQLQAQIDFGQDATYRQTLRSGSEVIKTFGKDSSSVYTLRDYYAALLVQHALRRHAKTKALHAVYAHERLGTTSSVEPAADKRNDQDPEMSLSDVYQSADRIQTWKKVGNRVTRENSTWSESGNRQKYTVLHSEAPSNQHESELDCAVWSDSRGTIPDRKRDLHSSDDSSGEGPSHFREIDPDAYTAISGRQKEFPRVNSAMVSARAAKASHTTAQTAKYSPNDSETDSGVSDIWSDSHLNGLHARRTPDSSRAHSVETTPSADSPYALAPIEHFTSPNNVLKQSEASFMFQSIPAVQSPTSNGQTLPPKREPKFKSLVDIKAVVSPSGSAISPETQSIVNRFDATLNASHPPAIAQVLVAKNLTQASQRWRNVRASIVGKASPSSPAAATSMLSPSSASAPSSSIAVTRKVDNVSPAGKTQAFPAPLRKASPTTLAAGRWASIRKSVSTTSGMPLNGVKISLESVNGTPPARESPTLQGIARQALFR